MGLAQEFVNICQRVETVNVLLLVAETLWLPGSGVMLQHISFIGGVLCTIKNLSYT